MANKTGRLSAVIALAPVDSKEQIFPDTYAKAAILLWAASHTKPNRLIDSVNFVQKCACRLKCKCEMAMVDNTPLPSVIQVIEPVRTLAGEGFWEIYGNLAT